MGIFVWIVSIVRFRASFFQFPQFFDLDLITLEISFARDAFRYDFDAKTCKEIFVKLEVFYHARVSFFVQI